MTTTMSISTTGFTHLKDMVLHANVKSPEIITQIPQ